MVEIILKNDRRSGGVEFCLAAPPVTLPHGQAGFGFVTRQTLVLEHNWNIDALTKQLNQRFYLRRLMSGRSIETPRPPHHYRLQAVVFSHQLLDLAQQHDERRRLRRRTLNQTPR